MRVLVDSDSLVYAAGFATQRTVYFTEEPEIVVEPIENALNMVKRSLETTYDVLSAWLEESGESLSHLELFLTGKNNFRDQIATIKQYKGNRLNKPKPVHYEAIRRYMVEQWQARIVDGHEADDEVTIISHSLQHDPERVAICSIDKDLKTVPGLLYSYRKQESELITEQEALVNFYRQVLTGDTIDNVGGCYRVGPKKAEQVITSSMDERGMWCAVLQEFEASVEKAGCPYKDARAAATENAQLLWLLREPGKVWTEPT